MTTFNPKRETLSLRGSGNRQDGFKPKPKKPRAWNHQDELKASIGKSIHLTAPSGDFIVGTLVAADQFTIKLALSKEGRDKSFVTYFKGNLTAYSIKD